MAAERLTVDGAIVEAACPYAYGENDCLTLIAALVRAGDRPAATVGAVEAALARNRGKSYPDALRAVSARHGTVGRAMLAELVEGAGLDPVSGEPEPGDILLFEGVAERVDGTLHSTAEQGTLEVVVDGDRDWWTWTTDGLRPVASVFRSAALAAAGGVRCLPR